MNIQGIKNFIERKGRQMNQDEGRISDPEDNTMISSHAKKDF